MVNIHVQNKCWQITCNLNKDSSLYLYTPVFIQQYVWFSFIVMCCNENMTDLKTTENKMLKFDWQISALAMLSLNKLII